MESDLKYVTKTGMHKTLDNGQIRICPYDESLLREGYTVYTYKDKSDIMNYYFNLGQPIKLLNIYQEMSPDTVRYEYEIYKLKIQVQKLSLENQEMKAHIEASPDSELFFELARTWQSKKIDL